MMKMKKNKIKEESTIDAVRAELAILFNALIEDTLAQSVVVLIDSSSTFILLKSHVSWIVQSKPTGSK